MTQPYIVLRVFSLPHALVRGRLCSFLRFFLVSASDFTILIFCRS